MIIKDDAVDNILIKAMLGPDAEVARYARRRFDFRHKEDPKIAEPSHCSGCFEGCPNCRPMKDEGPSIADLRRML